MNNISTLAKPSSRKTKINQIWLGIDPGLAIVGWAILEDKNNNLPDLIDYGIIETEKGIPTPKRLVEIEHVDISEGLITEFQPSNVAMEMPFFSRQIKAAGGNRASSSGDYQYGLLSRC